MYTDHVSVCLCVCTGVGIESHFIILYRDGCHYQRETVLSKTDVLPSPRTFQSPTKCEPGRLWLHLGVLVRVVWCVLINVCLSRFIDLGDVSLCDSKVCVPPPLPRLAVRACPFQVLRPGNFSTLSWATGNWSSLLPRICLPRVRLPASFHGSPSSAFCAPLSHPCHLPGRNIPQAKGTDYSYI